MNHRPALLSRRSGLFFGRRLLVAFSQPANREPSEQLKSWIREGDLLLFKAF